MSTLTALGDQWEREALADVKKERDRYARAAARCKEGGEYGAQMLRVVAMYDRMIAAAPEAQPVSAGLTDAQIFDLVAEHEVRAKNLWVGPRFTQSGVMIFSRALLSAAQQASQPVADTSADARDAALAEIHAFLLGDGPLEGVWYGDMKSDVEGDAAAGRYWWRRFLRAAIAASKEAQHG